MSNNNLSVYIRNFFQEYLTIFKGVSRHTILSYRDTIKLLMIFTAKLKKKSVTDLQLGDLNPDTIMQFLEHLEKQRGNCIATRNIRLSCIHSFFHYLAGQDPLIFDHCQRILGIPFKRTNYSSVEYLEREEMKAILESINRGNLDGYRDYALFTFMYNTGARVEEVISLCADTLQLERPFQVRLLGKGKKERYVPLWPETVKLLKSLLNQRGIDTKVTLPVFVNHRGKNLTRYGVRYLLNKYVQIAAKKCRSLQKKHVHPHTIRHTTAMHLLQAGVDINTIRAWLGHVKLETTNLYAEINLDMKRKVLDKYLPISKVGRPWKRNRKLIQWLDSL